MFRARPCRPNLTCPLTGSVLPVARNYYRAVLEMFWQPRLKFKGKFFLFYFWSFCSSLFRSTACLFVGKRHVDWRYGGGKGWKWKCWLRSMLELTSIPRAITMPARMYLLELFQTRRKLSSMPDSYSLVFRYVTFPHGSINCPRITPVISAHFSSRPGA